MDIPDEAFNKIMESNVRSNLWLAKMVAPDMIEKGSGSIAITSSTGAFGPSEVLGTYNISKLADIALVRNLAQELGPKAYVLTPSARPRENRFCQSAVG